MLKTEQIKTHPAAEIFPMLPAADLARLADDIKAQGLQHPLVMHKGLLLDGRNRLAACKITDVKPSFTEYEGDSPLGFVISVNIKRRQLNPSQRACVGVEIEPMFAVEAKKRMLSTLKKGNAPAEANLPQRARSPQARDQAADVCGVSPRMVQYAKEIKAADVGRFEKVKQGFESLSKARKEIKAEQHKRALSAARKSVSKSMRKSIESVCDLRVCSCAELFDSGIKPDAVITDPPYPREFLSVFTELALGCKAVGVPLVAVMSGQSYLPEVIQRLCQYLEYRWMLAYLTPGGQAVQQWEAKVNTAWKPVILFGESGEWFGDVAASKPNDNDKRFHEWGQSISGMADLVGRLTKPGQLICDPFLGAGSTAVVSLELGRRFVGCDIDASCVEQAKNRVIT